MSITTNLRSIQQTINAAIEKYHKPTNSVRLIAVSKGQPATAIQEAFTAGVSDFGENYWQEAQTKMESLRNLPLTWHFIGPIQSNKTAEIAKNFSWVHSVDRAKIAQLLSRHRSSDQSLLNVCIQINLDCEESKAGIHPDALPQLATLIHELPRIKLRGLMAIPKPSDDPHKQYCSLLRLSHLMQGINTQLELNLDTLSMGMTDDLSAAIHAGSTMVRIGRAIFGDRIKP